MEVVFEDNLYIHAPRIIVSKILEDEYMLKHESTFFDVEDTQIFSSDIDIYTDEGKLLLRFRKNVIPEEASKVLFKNLKSAAPRARGRAKAAGIPEDGQIYSYVKSKSSGAIIHQLNTRVRSGIVGYYDNQSFFGHKNIKDSNSLCRTTAFSKNHLAKYKETEPVFSLLSDLYNTVVPEKYLVQKEYIEKLNEEYIIPNTIFTTVTVNKNFRTALHKDAGDLSMGFGNLVVCSEGDYTGGYTMYPQYGIGVDCRQGDFLAMDVHEWHCNSPMEGEGVRLSFVMYMREKMLKCCPKSK